MQDHIMTQLTYMEQLAKLRLERIQELQEQIKNRRDMAHALDKVMGINFSEQRLTRVLRIKRLEDEADAWQARLDALLAQPLGDTPKNGEPRSEQGNWKGEA